MEQANKGIALSVDQLGTIFAKQETLNLLYTADYRSKVKLGQFLSASAEEFAETLQEVEAYWKWYNIKAVTRRNEAIFEVADTLHFMAAAILLPTNTAEIEHCLSMLQPERCVIKPSDDLMKDINRAYAEFVVAICSDLYTHAARRLIEVISGFCILLDCTADEMFRAYVTKNERNKQRVRGGVMAGTYDKSLEAPLEI